MTWAHPLQLQQLQLLWKHFLGGLGEFMGILNLSPRRTFLRSCTDGGQEDLAHSLQSSSTYR